MSESKRPKKRKYRNSVSFVVEAMRQCCANSLTLAAEAKAILDRGSHALSLSIAVLALEEIAKITLIDGLLLAKAGDYKTEMFEKGHKLHTLKLMRLPVLHLCVIAMARHDPRYETDGHYLQAILISAEHDRDIMSDVLRRMDPGEGFAALDGYKQRGFYVNAAGGGAPQAPNEVIPRELAEAVVLMAQRLTSFVDFVLSDVFRRYEEFAKKVRGVMSEEDHEALEAAVTGLFNEVTSWP
jgi:AbiV family abortive infection protein